MRRKTSVSVRTIVVLPVPPFWERTAIVNAIGPRTIAPRPWLLAAPAAQRASGSGSADASRTPLTAGWSMKCRW